MSERTKIALASLAMDLKRVALGLHRGSNKMSERFLKEAVERRKEIDKKDVDLYIRNILKDLDQNKDAEDLLMYSILLENYVRKKYL